MKSLKMSDSEMTPIEVAEPRTKSVERSSGDGSEIKRTMLRPEIQSDSLNDQLFLPRRNGE